MIKMCPECGCEMEQTDIGYFADDNGEPQVIETIYTCPGCDYEETTLDA